jgi:flagellar hook-associated protein 2
LVISSASATGVTAGTFTVGGKQITLATSDSLQQVFDKISTATGGGVTGSYDAATDKISFSSSSAIVLGSATDTSNFLQIAKLYNNGTANISSNSPLGAAPLSNTLASSNLQTSITDGGNGVGEFKINGVSITFNATTDSMSDTLARINNSAAGVTASYDSASDRFTLTNKTTGDIGVALEDVTGNFLAATKLSSGTLQRGNNLLYSINGGGQLISQSNTISEATSGLAGLTVTALAEKIHDRDIASDSVKLKPQSRTSSRSTTKPSP